MGDFLGEGTGIFRGRLVPHPFVLTHAWLPGRRSGKDIRNSPQCGPGAKLLLSEKSGTSGMDRSVPEWTRDPFRNGDSHSE
jgi:hypothetical protein